MSQSHLLISVHRRQLVHILFMLVTLQAALVGTLALAHAQAENPPVISNVEILTPSLARFDRFEMNFEMETVSRFVNLPFDADPPPGLQTGMGVSADALFSADNWQTTITQPAFHYQPYKYQSKGRDHLTPDGAPYWKVRFAPQKAGDWQVRLRVRDRGGETLFPADGALDFRVYEPGSERYQGLRSNPYTRHGFLRISAQDSRYFEFQDGTPFLGLGYNSGSDSVESVANRYRLWQQNGIEFARVWMNGMGINGSQWTPYAYPDQPNNYGLPTTLFGKRALLGDAELSFWLRPPFSCFFTDFWQGGIPVRPNTTYSLTVTAKLDNVVPRTAAPDAGFVVVREGWVNRTCDNLKNKPLMPARVGSTDWFTETTTLSTGANENFMNYLYFALKNIESGQVFIDEIRLVAQDDPAQVNLLHDPRADSHLHYDEMNAARWDLLIAEAEKHGVFLKIVTDEKNEWIRNTISPDGKSGSKFDNNNFYSAPNTMVRWLHQAWWRYLIARWGYSTAIHSFEFVNEGDPYNGNHYDVANAMARFFDANDPSQHLVTTSLWHSFPNPEFWSNPNFSAVDYADIHAYITTGWGNNAAFINSKYIETRPEHRYQGMNSLHLAAAEDMRESIAPRGVTLQEPGEWVIRYRMKQENFSAKCGFGEGGSSVRVYWSLDGGKRQGAVPGNIQGKDFMCTSPDGTFDWREFDSQTDRKGQEIAIEHRLVISDTLPHALELGISNQSGISGDAWIADVELISPSGTRVPVLGTFDTTRFDEDPAWFTAAYSLLWGDASPVGAHKPLVRGETQINSQDQPNGYPEMNLDKDGVWLHQFVWGLINPGGMYDMWWAGTLNIEDNEKSGRSGNLYRVFLPFANFMADIPLNNGEYRDADAVSDNPQVRVWGQRDDANGRAHLWIQNLEHSWQNVIAGKAIMPVEALIRLKDLESASYRIEWWSTHDTVNQVLKSEIVEVNGDLTLTLPGQLTTDIAVKIERLN
ncbi:MAG: hypothetical protein IT331_08960 [Anaerolineae bacterium]|nr:hypothetical protein [Anaerolineae bacterium]